MIINKINKKIILFLLLGIFSIFINNFYGNLGIFPSDTLGFFDTAYSILEDKHPIRDFWIFSGLLVDYIQVLFFKLFGLQWSSYVLHASFFNLIIATFVFFSLNKHGLNIYYSFFYSLAVAILCYPVAGTPFAYQHSFILSLVSVLIFTLAIKTKHNLYWFLLPITMVLAFLSQQVPSSYINLIIIILAITHFINKVNRKNFYYFIFGSLLILSLISAHFAIFQIPLKDFIIQYILFPLTVGGERIAGDERAFVSLGDKLTFRGIFGHFKFIHIFNFSLIYITFLNYFEKSKFVLTKEEIIINLILILSTIAFIFHQLITANQTFIFSLIPILAGFVHLYLQKYYSKNKTIQFIVILMIIFSSIKYHNVYNVKRKFMDLQFVDLSKAIDASLIDVKLKNLKWITPYYYGKNPEKEINLIKNTVDILKNDKREKMVITNYQFFSLILEQDLNIPNRWSLHHHNLYPIKNHKYFEYYKDFFNRKLKSSKIEVIYIIKSHPKESIKIEHFKIYLDDICFKDNKISEILSSHEIVSCN